LEAELEAVLGVVLAVASEVLLHLVSEQLLAAVSA